MKLIKGINRDDNPVNQPSGTWRDAQGIIVDTASNLKVEEGLKDYYIHIFDTLCGKIELDKDFIIFGYSIISGVKQNYVVHVLLNEDADAGTHITILNTNLFNFKKESPIQGEYRYNYKGETIIVWYSDNDIPRFINISDPNIDLTQYKEFVNPEDVIHTSLFPIAKLPIFKIINVVDSGGSLDSGVYQISIQYKLIDNSFSNFYPLSNPIFVNSFSPKDDWYNCYADKPGTVTSKYIHIRIENLDERYKTFRLGIVYRLEGSIKSYIGKEYTVANSEEIGIHSIMDLLEVNISEFIIGTLDFKRIEASTVINNVLYIINPTIDDEPDFQKYACNIKVEPVYDKYIELKEYKNSYKDEILLFDGKTLTPNEVYALYIRLIRKSNGKTSKAFHIPGRTAFTGETDGDTNIIHNEIYKGCRNFHFNDTSMFYDIDDSFLRMGYWENETELYPNTDEFNGISVQTPIEGGVDLRNQHIRHHKMPSFYTLMKLAEINNPTNKPNRDKAKPIVLTTQELEVEHTITLEDLATPNATPYFRKVRVDIGWVKDGNKYVNSSGSVLKGKHFYDILFYANPLATAKIKIWQYYGDGSPRRLIDEFDELALNGRLSGHELNLILSPGDFIWYEMVARGISKHLTIWRGHCEIYLDSTTTSTLSGKILGLKLSNIQIPDHIKEEYTHYEILFAKRQQEDITVIGQGLLLKPEIDNSGDGEYDNRFYSFDALHNRTSLGITHMSYMYEALNISLDVANSGIFLPRTDGTEPADSIVKSPIPEIYPIVKAKYVAGDYGHARPANSGREEFIALYFKEDTYNTSELPSSGMTGYRPPVSGNGDVFKVSVTDNMTVIAINSFKADLYKSFMNQRLVRTGTLFDINSVEPRIKTIGTTRIEELNIYNTGKLYGFDTVFTPYGITTFKANTSTTTDMFAMYLIAIFSISNIAYRRKDEYKAEQYFFPKISYVQDGYEGTLESALHGLSNDTVSEKDIATLWAKAKASSGTFHVSQLPEHYDYHNDLNAMNDLQVIPIFNPEIENILTFIGRIHRSIPQASETLAQNWRIFKINEYYDSVYNKGILYNIDNNGRDLIIMHTSAMFVTSHLTELRFADGVASSLGASDIFSNIPIEIIPSASGYVGCQSKFASFRTKVGNVIIDREQGKIFLYNGAEIEEISKYGLERWFKKNLQYELDGESRDLFEIDNPYISIAIIAAYDDKYNRLIVTKRFIHPVTGDDYSWTCSYYPGLKMWASRHYYNPDVYMTTRRGVFTYFKDSNKFKFLNGGFLENLGCKIDVVFNEPKVIDKRYISILWNTLMTNHDNITLPNITFDRIIVYNYNRHSNRIELENYVFPYGNVRQTGGTWKFNDFRDMLKNKSSVVMDKFDIEELQYEVINSADIEDDWTQQGKFIDDFIVVRFIFFPRDNIIQINDVGINTDSLQR